MAYKLGGKRQAKRYDLALDCFEEPPKFVWEGQARFLVLAAIHCYKLGN
jgi:hypothetical protein